MSDVICPICGLKYSPISHRFLNPELCPHHDDLVWRNKYDALQRKLDKAIDTLNEVIYDVRNRNQSDPQYIIEIVEKALEQLEGE